MSALPKTQETVFETVNNTPRSVAVPRICLVTGGTGGIGMEICKQLARAGHTVATTYRNEEKAKAWAAEMKKEG
jgi:NADP-dependent 3-hydroxy acid dehydrogenase YdfG